MFGEHDGSENKGSTLLILPLAVFEKLSVLWRFSPVVIITDYYAVYLIFFD